MSGQGEPPKDDRRTRAMAREAVEHHFGSKVRRLTRLEGGLTNFVYRAAHAEGDFVVRMNSDPVKINDFLKEQWAVERARQAGVPAAEVYEVGNQVGMPYMIARASAGASATDHPMRISIVEELGRILARIHTIGTNGFGETFDWSRNQLSRLESWVDYLDGPLNVDGRLRLLTRHKMISSKQRKALDEVLAKISRWKIKPVLNHGDLRLKNLLVDRSGEIEAVIDWEFCVSSAPHWDVSLALHDLSIDQKQALLRGYGLSSSDVRDMAPAWKAINILNYARFVEQSDEEGDEAQLEEYRVRLSGALDLYSL